jgi:hypothetical protein
MPKKREPPYVPPSGKAYGAGNLPDASVHAQTWFEARELGSVALGIPLERVCAKRVET